MNRIICPVDFSDKCRNALDYAFALAQASKSSLALLHVYELSEKQKRAKEADLQDIIRKEEETRYKKLSQFLPKTAIHTATEYIFKRGNSLKKTQEYINNNYFNCLILGSAKQSSSSFRDLFFGNHLEELVTNVHIPVMIVPENAPFRAIQKVAYATTFIDDNILALQDLDDFAKAFQANIHILHVDSRITERDEQLILRYRRAIGKLLSVSFRVQVLEQKNPIKAIQDYLVEQNIDLLIALRKQRSFTEKMFHTSFTNKILSQLIKPILILQEETTLNNAT